MGTGTMKTSRLFALLAVCALAAAQTQATGQGKAAIYPKNETAFSPKEFVAEIDFQCDEAGAVTGLVLNQGGRKMPATRR
jgi:hypothetical protein